MMNHRVFENLELAFWDTTIPMLTGVRSINKCGRQLLYHWRFLLRPLVSEKVILPALVWSAIGLAFGLLLGLISAAL